MFFETLEARQLLVSPQDAGTIWETYPGNYVPDNEYRSAGANYGPLTGPSTANKETIAINYLKQNAAFFDAIPSDFNHYTVSRQYTDAHNNVTHIYLQQTFNTLPVADAVANISINEHGQIIAVGANFVSGLPHPTSPFTPQPAITPGDALALVGAETQRSLDVVEPEDFQFVGGPSQKVIFNGLEHTALSYEDIPIELHYVPKPGGGVELAWKLTAHYSDELHWFEASVGAQTGGRLNQIIRLDDWTDYATYNVFPVPSDGPLDLPRLQVVNPQDPVASPFGWHDTDGVAGAEFMDTRGNNVSAQEDTNGDNAGGNRPNGGAGLVFNFPLDVTQAPNTYVDAATTNLFYWNNINHDVLFHYGFTEAAGNFQVTNYTGAGIGNDPVQADAQDGSGTNNATFGTPPDGQSGRMTMFLFNLTTPNRDGDLDGFIMTHEFGHGVSNRLTGGPANAGALQNLQSGGMGEGWSDWLGLMFTQKPADGPNDPQASGNWVLGQPANGPGIRRFPYSFDMAINPQTLGDFNGGFPNNEVHNAGELWCSALWDLNWGLIERYGYDSNLYTGNGGNNLALQLVLDGMKLQPANPTFIEARDAIFAADQALTGGANVDELWTAFARRGFGLSASAGPDSNSPVVVEAFDKPPPSLRVSGKVINDRNGNGQINAGDNGLAGWTIFADSNNNGQLDQGERSTVTAANGTYQLTNSTNSPFVLREIVQQNWRPIKPPNGAITINPSDGRTQTGKNFLNQAVPGEIHGIKFNDLNGDGIKDPGEPGIAGVVIYVDLNQNGSIGILEPAAVTDAAGRYQIKNVLVGNDYMVREVAGPGMEQTFPDPADTATLGGAHINVVVNAASITPNINFGNMRAFDFGDAPASYGTLLAGNGARHATLPGFGLTLTPWLATNVVDTENNGQPDAAALGDDQVPGAGPDDENGVAFPAALVPGSLATVQVGVRTGSFSPGMLHAWVDFNGDGDFTDAGEQIFNNHALRQGVHNLQFAVPTGATLGATFARFRYSYTRDLTPFGEAMGGEVEDLATNVLLDQAVANNDVFPNLALGDPFIKFNSDFTDNLLNVLRNDFGTIDDPNPLIDPTDFTGPGLTKTTAAGGTVKFIAADQPLQYKPKPGFAGPDSFTYRVTAGGTTSAPATVSLTVSIADPVAIDDLFPLTPGSDVPPRNIDVLLNDLPRADIRIVGAPVALSPIPAGLTLTTRPDGQMLLLTRAVGTPAATFTGSVQYQYTIDDNNPTTDPATAIVTLQITADPNTPAASHKAYFKTQYREFNPDTGEPGNVVSVIDMDVSEFFYVEFVVQDPAGDLPTSGGVDSAFIDLIIQQGAGLIEPVLIGGTTYDILFEPSYQAFVSNTVGNSKPGVLEDIGAVRGAQIGPTPPPTGNGEVTVMFVKFRALSDGIVKVQADHSDSPETPISLFVPGSPPSQLELGDHEVFIQPAGTLTIVGPGGEGDFTNFREVHDVNNDQNVNPLDILSLVNDLTQYGSRSLDLMSIATSGIVPTTFLDVNIDSNVNTLDILGVVNFLTARGSTSAPVVPEDSGEGEGEGESASTFAASSASGFAASVDSQIGAMVNFLANQDDQAAPTGTTTSEPLEVVLLGGESDEDETTSQSQTTADDSLATTTSRRGRTSEVDADSADELFASLSSLRDRLSRRRR